ncbi:MAG TPA: DNA (cytosine-5-)-methyltransferase [Spirochaetia bacterium]|nr:DNA (cytosine-5-)-methyltransferase [Spirochaetia bacterium]
MKKLTAVDLFSGAGGLSIGIERAGFEVILANEIEKDFAKTYSLNHPNTKILNCDIHTVDFTCELSTLGIEIGAIDLLCGGPPCQGFSTVGSKNKKDPRNSLFYEFIRATIEIKPKYILFENVSGFKKMYNGEAYKTVLNELKELGYNSISSVLEASDYGLPQNRQRTIILGWRNECIPLSFPEITHFQEINLFGGSKKLCLMDAISDLPPLGFNDEKHFYFCSPQNNYQKKLRGNETVLTEHNSSDYGEKMKKILKLVPEGGTVDDLPEYLRPKNYFKNTYSRLLPYQPSPTITRNFGTPSSSRCIHPFQPRALSTREGARLQGFPDSYKFFGSKTSKNLQIGNAVPPIFGEVIANEIVNKIIYNNKTKIIDNYATSVSHLVGVS